MFASPLARRLAQQKGVDLAGLKGSGPRGRIIASDIDEAKPGAAASAAPQGAAPPSIGAAPAGPPRPSRCSSSASRRAPTS